jgi:putative PIN family toxin of toxin-antitoxin system
MQPLRIVLDTNALLRSISRLSSYSLVLDRLYDHSYELYISNEIQLEYEEKITQIFSKEIAEIITGAFSLLENVKKIDIHFSLALISADMEDNKFSDCAFAGNVHFLVTDDKHFNILKTTMFPAINVISLEVFKNLLLKNG